MNPHAGPPADAQPLECSARIDRVCIQFEDAWQAAGSESGGAPSLLQYVVGWEGADRTQLLKELVLLDIDYRRQRGQQPTADDYWVLFPENRELIANLFGIPTPGETGEWQAGQQVGRYVVSRLLGSGSFGHVYLAWDGELNRFVALKTPRLSESQRIHRVDELIDEARMSSQIDHPAIVPVLDVVRDARGLPVIVMPYIEGCSLRERLKQKPFTYVESATLLIEVADAMDFAHRRGFVHRDLKPRNILLDKQGRPHVTDFGLALHESTQRDRAGEVAGSPEYMSPEQLRGIANWLDGRSDIWALGVILYELLTGRCPFQGRDFDEVASEIFAREPKPPRQIHAEIPVELERICLTCLSKWVGDRFATARDLADALRQAIAPAPHRKEEPERQSPHWRLSMALWLGTLAVSVVLVGVIFAAVFPNRVSKFATAGGAKVPDIELMVWNDRDELRGRINGLDQSASPLRAADKVRLGVTLDQPSFLYVLWIGTDGDLNPIYPWTPGKWNRPTVEAATAQLSLPSVLNQTWRVEAGAAGVESVLVLVTERPLPADLELPKLLAPIRSQVGIALSEPLRFENGRLQPRVPAEYRSPDFTSPVPIDSPLIANQTLIAEKLGRYCASIHALCFPISGDNP